MSDLKITIDGGTDEITGYPIEHDVRVVHITIPNDEHGREPKFTIHATKYIVFPNGNKIKAQDSQSGYYVENGIVTDKSGNVLNEVVRDANWKPTYDEDGKPIYQTDEEGNLIPRLLSATNLIQALQPFVYELTFGFKEQHNLF